MVIQVVQVLMVIIIMVDLLVMRVGQGQQMMAEQQVQLQKTQALIAIQFLGMVTILILLQLTIPVVQKLVQKI
jgi:hypothetical protein